MTNMVQIYRPALEFLRGFLFTHVGDDSFTIGAGSCTDSTNSFVITLDATTTLNGAVVGANGIDTGSLGASKLYYVYVIGDSSGNNVPATLISLSATPLLPSGYSIYRRIGYYYTNGSSDFIKVNMRGNGDVKTYWYDAAISVLAAGAAETFTAVTLTNVPPVSTNVILQAQFTPATAADSAGLRPAGSSSTAGFTVVSGVVAAKEQLSQVVMPCGVASSLAKVEYKNSAASCALTLQLLGFEDYL